MRRMRSSLFLLRRGASVLLARRKAGLVAFWRTVWGQGLWPFLLFSGCVFVGTLFLLFMIAAALLGLGAATLVPEGTPSRDVATSLVLCTGGMVFFSMACFLIYAALLPLLQRRWPALRVPKEHHTIGLMGASTIGGSFLTLALVDVLDAGRVGVTVGGLSVVLALLVLVGRVAFALPPALRRVQDTGLASLSAHQRLSLLARRAARPHDPPPPQA